MFGYVVGIIESIQSKEEMVKVLWEREKIKIIVSKHSSRMQMKNSARKCTSVDCEKP